MSEIQKFTPDKGLEQPVSKKVKTLIELGRLSPDGPGRFLCLPIFGYNKTTYTLTLKEMAWVCNCQGFTVRGYCAHVQALLLSHPELTKKDDAQGELFT